MVRIIDNTGDTADNAVIIEADSSTDAVNAEYAYIARKYGQRNKDWTLKMQAVFSNNDRHYDLISIVLASGEEARLYFDITSFYGKNSWRIDLD